MFLSTNCFPQFSNLRQFHSAVSCLRICSSWSYLGEITFRSYLLCKWWWSMSFSSDFFCSNWMWRVWIIQEFICSLQSCLNELDKEVYYRLQSHNVTLFQIQHINCSSGWSIETLKCRPGTDKLNLLHSETCCICFNLLSSFTQGSRTKMEKLKLLWRQV